MDYYFKVDDKLVEDHLEEFSHYLSDKSDHYTRFNNRESQRFISLLLTGKPRSSNSCKNICGRSSEDCNGAYGKHCNLLDRYWSSSSRERFNDYVKFSFNYIALYHQVEIEYDVKKILPTRYKFFKYFLAYNAKEEYDSLGRKAKGYVDNKWGSKIEVPQEPELDFQDYDLDLWNVFWKGKEKEKLNVELNGIIGINTDSALMSSESGPD